MLADIDAIRARAALPPEQTTIPIAGWGDFRVQRITIGQKQEFQRLVREGGQRVTVEAAQVLLAAALVPPTTLTDADVVLFYGHPDFAAGLEALVNQIAEWCAATPGAAQEAVRAAEAGFPDRADGAGAPAGNGRLRDGVVPTDRGDDPGRDAGADGLGGVPALGGLQGRPAEAGRAVA